MAIRGEVRGTQALRRALAKAGKVGVDALAKGLYRQGQLVMRDSKREVPVDENILRSSGFVDLPRKTATGAEVRLGYGGAASGYAIYLHEGTGPAVGKPPFMPPVEAFKGWAKRVLGDEDLAFVVARAVGRRGLKPRKFLENPLKARIPRMPAALTRDVRKAMREAL